MIRLENISKIYKQNGKTITALHNINLQIAPGKICGVIGHSGAGKSTLLRCVNLLERPTTGKVWVGQQELTSMSAADLRQARRQIGMIFQHFNLLNSQNAYNNIALPLRLSHTSSQEQEKRIKHLLAITGLTERQHAYPSQLSGGQKQRVAIARAIATQPAVLLCDEATSALDPHTTRAILGLLRDINQKLGLTILLITHEMDVIKRLCDQVVVMQEGNIIEQDTIINIFTRPKEALTQQFVHAAFHEELPDYWLQRIQKTPASQCYPLLRLIFAENSAAQPIVAEISRICGVNANILEAHMEMIQQHTVGSMLLTIQSDQPAILQKALDFFAQQHVITEVVGYVHASH